MSPSSSPQRFAAVVRLRPEKEAEYRALHAAVWPSVLQRMTECNISNFSIFLRDGLLFSYLEYVGDDYARDMAVLGADDENRRWLALTGPCQDPVATAAEGQLWSSAEELFHLD